MLALAMVLLFRSAATSAVMSVGEAAPEITAEHWLNSSPLSLAGLRGKVVLIEFWTFGCYNCRNVEPHVKAFYRKYASQGFAVIGVHSPEQSFERDPANVERYVRAHEIAYPVAIDGDFAVWDRYRNVAWPALYLIDKHGRVRLVQMGEGGYEAMDRQIAALLQEN